MQSNLEGSGLMMALWMENNMNKSFLISLLLMACTTQTTPYYAAENAVSVSSVDIESQMGNIGGLELTITGSGFGTDKDLVSVMFGNQNATVLDVTDSTITVVTPRGPVKGGKVDVRVGTPSGRAQSRGGRGTPDRVTAPPPLPPP